MGFCIPDSAMFPEKCKEIGVRRVGYSLTPREIVPHLLHGNVYRKTRYIVLNRGKKWAIAEVGKKTGGRGIFRKISRVRIISLPRETAYAESEIDVSNRPAMAELYVKQRKRFLIVGGRYEHISFIGDERLAVVNVIDMVPPAHPHLVEAARKSIECGMVEAPVRIEEKIIDIRKLAGKAKTKYLMFPCSCSAIKLKNSYFLDKCPDLPRDVLKNITLIGCNRSAKIFRAVYGIEPRRISTCPLDLAGKRRTLTLTRCCELKQKVKVAGSLALVPWDASIRQAAKALNMLAKGTKG